MKTGNYGVKIRIVGATNHHLANKLRIPVNYNFKGPLSVLRQFLTTLKMLKNAFYFTSKDLLTLFVWYPNGLIKKIRLILHFMTSHPG